MSSSERIAVVGGASTPFAGAGTHLKERTPVELGTHTVNAALEKADLDPTAATILERS